MWVHSDPLVNPNPCLELRQRQQQLLPSGFCTQITAFIHKKYNSTESILNAKLVRRDDESLTNGHHYKKNFKCSKWWIYSSTIILNEELFYPSTRRSKKWKVMIGHMKISLESQILEGHCRIGQKSLVYKWNQETIHTHTPSQGFVLWSITFVNEEA